eukprot:6193909-Pleurochrysis_carterae.AAC.1
MASLKEFSCLAVDAKAGASDDESRAPTVVQAPSAAAGRDPKKSPPKNPYPTLCAGWASVSLGGVG